MRGAGPVFLMVVDRGFGEQLVAGFAGRSESTVPGRIVESRGAERPAAQHADAMASMSESSTSRTVL